MSSPFSFLGLNPCCNGRCTRTQGRSLKALRPRQVLILVVMEDALALYAGKWAIKESRPVLILVVMEDALAPERNLFGGVRTNSS